VARGKFQWLDFVNTVMNLIILLQKTSIRIADNLDQIGKCIPPIECLRRFVYLARTVFVYMYVCVFVCMYLYMYMYVCMYVYTTYICVCMYVYVCNYVCVCLVVCMGNIVHSCDGHQVYFYVYN
jgi:nuclear pore complex protein Nup62